MPTTTATISPSGSPRSRKPAAASSASTSARRSVKSSAWRSAALRSCVSGASGRARSSTSLHGRTMSMGRAATLRRTTSMRDPRQRVHVVVRHGERAGPGEVAGRDELFDDSRPKVDDLVGRQHAQQRFGPEVVGAEQAVLGVGHERHRRGPATSRSTVDADDAGDALAVGVAEVRQARTGHDAARR